LIPRGDGCGRQCFPEPQRSGNFNLRTRKLARRNRSLHMPLDLAIAIPLELGRNSRCGMYHRQALDRMAKREEFASTEGSILCRLDFEMN
jgi:hypothetical protein